MEEGEVEFPKAKSKQPEIVDLFSEPYRLHWTVISKLSGVLSRGLYSPDFASRIGDKDYAMSNLMGFPRPQNRRKSVHLTSGPGGLFINLLAQESEVVGILVASKHRMVPFRVAPRKFMGLVLIDKAPENGRFKLEKMNEAALRFSSNFDKTKKISESAARPLLIYGIWGDLYWPQRMSYEEIVSMLEEKEK